MAIAPPLTKTRRTVIFRLDGRRVPRARSVALVGAFNEWNHTVHVMTPDAEGCWTVSVNLAPGSYPYLFLVDGVPWNDLEDDGRVGCEWGGQYSLRVVR
jgi:1,4-alpha-glucan branching enzyme